MKVLLSIKPEYVKSIFEGKKKYEYRKCIFKREDITTVVVYATKPEGKVVGEFEIEKILADNPENIWKTTKRYSGISEDFFKEYFFEKDMGFAIQIKSFVEYEEHLSLSDFNESIRVAPQSFCYIE